MKRPGEKTSRPLRAALIAAMAACLLPGAAQLRAQDRAQKTFTPRAEVISHNLSITVSPFARTLRGTDTIKLKPSGGRLRLVLNRKARLQRVRLNGKKPHYSVGNLKEKTLKEIIIDLPSGKGRKKPFTLSISFNETFDSIKSAEKRIKRGISYVNVGVMGRRGIFLPSYSYWYPHTEDGTADYNISINMPRGYTTVSEGDWLLHMNSADRTFDRWKTTHPIDGLDLISSRFKVKKAIHNGVKIYTFFLKWDKKLSATYIKKTGEYIDLYSGLFGKYPFRKFAVVESFLPTGYGMPSFTLLGSKVLRLPFIPDTSLGHEIAHSWWGNSVFIDASYGNWSEALTTYTADYLYERRKGKDKAREFRFRKLEGYKNYARADAPSLRAFKYATDPPERAVGYNKGLMVFAMLEDLIGTETFNKGLREFYEKNAFRRATWKDLEKAFASVTDHDLTWFFTQWLERSGGPELALSGVEAARSDDGSGFTVTFSISQKTPSYRLNLPVRLSAADNEVVEKNIEVDNEKTEAVMSTKGAPLLLEVDPDYRVFRILSASEVPPSLSVVLGDKDGLIVVSKDKAGLAGRTEGAKLLSKDYGLKVGGIKDGEIQKVLSEKSVFFIGGPGLPAALKDVPLDIPEDISIKGKTFGIKGKTYDAATTALAISLKNPYNADKNIVIFATGASAQKTILSEIKKIRYFTKYSYVLIQKGKAVEKGMVPAKNALTFRFAADDAAAEEGGAAEKGGPEPHSPAPGPQGH